MSSKGNFCLISKTFVFIKDANVPYRLIKQKALLGVINKIPKNMWFLNGYGTLFHPMNIKIQDKKFEYLTLNEINEMTAMLDSYMSFVRGETPEPIRQIKLNEFVKEICKNIKIVHHKLITNINSNILLSGRPLQLKRSISNIIENSIRYSKKIQVNVSDDKENCFIEISDDGPGIPENNYEDIFKPFFTLDPSRNKLKGESGLGMTIARDIVRSHGGDIKLSKSYLGGLKTIINLPI